MLQVVELDALPPIPAGYIRVVRGELPMQPRSGVPYIPECWWGMPTPQNDGISEFRGMNCAAYLHTLSEWWPVEERKVARAEGMHFVVLDVPKHACKEGVKQAVIERNAAVSVALIH